MATYENFFHLSVSAASRQDGRWVCPVGLCFQARRLDGLVRDNQPVRTLGVMSVVTHLAHCCAQHRLLRRSGPEGAQAGGHHDASGVGRVPALLGQLERGG
jgi:hypothetical protein